MAVLMATLMGVSAVAGLAQMASEHTKSKKNAKLRKKNKLIDQSITKLTNDIESDTTNNSIQNSRIRSNNKDINNKIESLEALRKDEI